MKKELLLVLHILYKNKIYIKKPTKTIICTSFTTHFYNTPISCNIPLKMEIFVDRYLISQTVIINNHNERLLDKKELIAKRETEA